jgi:small-conductance mechanosensitive channel
MSTAIGEKDEPTYGQPSSANNTRNSQDGRPSQDQTRALPSYNVNSHRNLSQDKSSDEEGTVVDDFDHFGSNEKENVPVQRNRANSHLTVRSEYEGEPIRGMPSPSQTREQAHRLEDDLEMVKIERQVSKQNEMEDLSQSKSRTGDSSMYRSKSRRREEHVDEFDEATNPVHEKTQVYTPVEHPSTGFGKFVKQIHGSNWLVRWVTYITPLTLILLIPLLLGVFVFPRASVGGVKLVWFMIWLEIVWLSLWAGRILAKCLPWPIGLVSSLFTNNSKKWRDMGKQLELPATLFFWWLAIEVSFLPTMTNHLRGNVQGNPDWLSPMNKVLISLFVAAILNFIEKIIVQLIAISFHLRTYADRIELNKFQIGSLTKLYRFSKEKIAMEDSEFEAPSGDLPGSGAITPGQIATGAAKQTKAAFNKFGDVAGKVAGDFTGKQTMKSTHPHQVVLSLLHSTSGAQVLARRLYRTFAREETETVVADDLRSAFENNDEADAAFAMFDKDMNGDISMEELEAVCVEIGRERKSITASLKDLDSVVAKLDDVFMFIVFVIVVLVFISLISASASGVLTSAGSAVLALSWLFSATAQEFLQSVIFVFVKHPFDVGDRVSVYGNTGAAGLGDDYFVKEISLLYTEFKKMEGHVVQAPNSYLNTLFILNQRRSGGLAEAVPISIKFGTTLEQIDGFRQKLLDFVLAENREYQGKILTELRDVSEVHSLTLNVIFFYKSNWQNEGLRLARRNKFICAMMVSMQELGIEGPRMRYPGQKQSFPVYLQNVPHVKVPGGGHSGHPDQPNGVVHDEEPEEHQDPPFVAPPSGREGANGSQAPARFRTGSILKGSGRTRGESMSQMSRRVDFSLGAKSAASGDMSGDVFEDRSRTRIPTEVQEASRSRERERETDELRASLEKSLRQSHDSGRTTSRDDRFLPGHLNRVSTDSGSRWRGGTVHRNRFFGRNRPGTGDEQILMEGGMADIPENPSTSGSQAPSERLDPRTGMVSPQAWRMTTNESNIHPPQIQPGRGSYDIANLSIAPDGHRPVGRSQTEDFEMRRFHQ